VLGPVGRPQKHDPSRLHEEHAKIAGPPLRDAAEDGSIAGRDLSRHKPEPSTEITTRRKADPSPMVATMALAMIGPMPGTSSAAGTLRHHRLGSRSNQTPRRCACRDNAGHKRDP
jgi:hypothetical protein